jgi:hypothetical protein
MSLRYMIRMFEDIDKTGNTAPGTLVQPVELPLSAYAESADDAESKVRVDVAAGKLPAGRVYQVCPWVGNPELIRSISISLEGACSRVFLDPASGPYGYLRRIRLPVDSPHNESPPAQLTLFEA